MITEALWKRVMTEVTCNADLIVSATGIILSCLGLMQVMISRYMERETRIFFIAVFLMLAFYMLCIITREMTRDNTGYEWVLLSRVVLFGQALLSSVLTLMVTGLLLYQSGERELGKNRIFRVTVALWMIYVAILIYAQFTTHFYTLDLNNDYERGPMFPVIMVVPLVIMGIDIVLLWRRRDCLTRRQRIAFAIYIILPMIAMILQTRLFGAHLIAMSTVIAAMVMFVYMFTDQVERYQVQERENARLKIDILLAQVQPHFIFNSLTTIKYLCRRDPEKAEETVTRFMSYLRNNMNSLTIDVPIPFKDELDHVKGYLDLQKIRFGDRLNTEYDLECTDFEIPTLTLLPLVENAVTYGVTKNENMQGTVTIRTREHQGHIEVSVADDGPGFIRDVMPDDRTRSHTGIRNVKERLQTICGGELKIDSEVGKGTTATIILTRGEIK